MSSGGTLDDLPPFLPMDAFSVEVPVHSLEEKKQILLKKHAFPDFSSLTFEEPFAHLAMGWSTKGLRFEVVFNKPFESCFFPDYRKGDSVELLINTRPLKTVGFPTRFCHHFVFLPREVEGTLGAEVTRLGGDEQRAMCDSALLHVHTTFKRSRFAMEIFLPSEVLQGYDPKEFNHLGFAYRINRFAGEPMHFPIADDYFESAQHPGLWSALKLTR